ncbi:Protein kinase domain [Arabidopsis thaliana x Arabidopsis arenosa]|uniref:Protein kinase domain n=1 Tax=Arabidopsis thaliana x Arabidopsis arenosa TaxID=1240361 RepID=A0A8T1ZNK2_9BRAS|nr:Protein kinase domain [Arabidopsis thaliana x Arabidopsis arenosa]KAG7560003.1 Protein kinase domain [Arabidopsis thaliana x Arabidopsis arenosa]KAG7560004.1 Protein kinase domain [Arabidopsis thaliana x Arabidopsis arenosa]KAG7560005.1 Protein kinase domain [Arabidopsis thaliana x Arabidopsis arenosa]
MQSNANRCLRNCSCLAFAYINKIGCLVGNQELLDMVQFTEEGEFLSIRLACSELARGKRIKIIAVSAISLCVFFILVLAAFGCWRYRVKQNGEARVAMDISEDSWKNGLRSHDVSGSNFFEMHTIQAATDNFSVSNKLGQGGFGTVYKGKLKDGKEIAIKRLSNSSGEGTEEFMNELKLISKLQHRNLVRLLGYCIEGEEKLLIYEFMVNKSLDTFLFDLKKKLEIDWPKRFNIIQGITRGLLYLHHDSFLRVVHHDLKASNILLDEKMNPKISDFGLARKFQGTQNQDNSGRVFGTLGYMSPEYAWTGTHSEKSDMYSFGVLMLEIISGKEISSFSHGKEEKNLVAYAWRSWSETGGVDLLDQDIDVLDSVEAVMRCVQIGLLCVQHQAMDRPNIKQVVSMLTSTMDLPKPEQPMFVSDTMDSLSLKSNHCKDLSSDDENKQESP